MTKQAELERQEGITRLREILKPGDTVYTILRHVSSSGMSRQISPVVIIDGKPDDISWEVAKLGIWKRKYPHDSLTVGGCGMDMGFHVVYELSHVLFPDGFGLPCIHCGKRPQNPNQERAMRLYDTTVGNCKKNNNKPHEFRGRNANESGWDTDGGYALHQKWL